MIIDRSGSEWGRYLAPDGTPYADRAPPESVGADYKPICDHRKTAAPRLALRPRPDRTLVRPDAASRHNPILDCGTRRYPGECKGT
ncbi:hypothetical protein [Mycobacterium sp. 20KCMC460]